MLALAVLLAAVAPEPLAAQAGPPPEIAAAIERLAHVERALADVRCTFHRREYLHGALQPEEIVELKWRRRGDVYMKWRDGLFQRELLWRPEDGNVRVTTPILTLELAPDSALVRAESRHSPADAGPAFVARNIVADTARARSAGGSRFTPSTRRAVHGRSALCWFVDNPDGAGLYARRAELCVDDATGLPTLARVWRHEDGALRLVEDTSYADLAVNTGLAELDFSTKNPAYRF